MAFCAFGTAIWVFSFIFSPEIYELAFGLFSAQGVLGFRGSWRRTVEAREKEREGKWREWLSHPFPELEPPTDWAEIERATAALLDEGIDPTFERARDWLRREAVQLACEHDGEWYQTDQSEVYICSKCGFHAHEDIILWGRGLLGTGFMQRSLNPFRLDQTKHAFRPKRREMPLKKCESCAGWHKTRECPMSETVRDEYNVPRPGFELMDD